MRRYHRAAESFEFVLPADRDLPAAERTTFVLRPMTLAERARAWDERDYTVLLPDGTKRLESRAVQQAVELARDHIEEVKNFPVGESPLDWPRDGSAADRTRYLAMMSEGDVIAVGVEVRDRAEVPADAGKSSPATPT